MVEKLEEHHPRTPARLEEILIEALASALPHDTVNNVLRKQVNNRQLCIALERVERHILQVCDGMVPPPLIDYMVHLSHQVRIISRLYITPAARQPQTHLDDNVAPVLDVTHTRIVGHVLGYPRDNLGGRLVLGANVFPVIDEAVLFVAIHAGHLVHHLPVHHEKVGHRLARIDKVGPYHILFI